MSALARAMLDALRERPLQFSELVDLHRDVPWREFLISWGELRTASILKRDEDGRYLVEDSRSGEI